MPREDRPLVAVEQAGAQRRAPGWTDIGSSASSGRGTAQAAALFGVRDRDLGIAGPAQAGEDEDQGQADAAGEVAVVYMAGSGDVEAGPGGMPVAAVRWRGVSIDCWISGINAIFYQASVAFLEPMERR